LVWAPYGSVWLLQSVTTDCKMDTTKYRANHSSNWPIELLAWLGWAISHQRWNLLELAGFG
jgi:hypothetical protein